MPGSVTRDTQVVPITTPITQGAGDVAGSGTGLDGASQIPFFLLIDETNPAGKVPLMGMAQEGTDSTDANATQATAGVGLRGWLSTLVSLFRSGAARVTLTGNPAQDATTYVRGTLVGGGTLSSGGTNQIDFGRTVGKVIVQNNTASSLWLDYLTPATAGSFKVGADRTGFFDLQGRYLYLYVVSGGVFVNGTVDGGVVIWGS